MPKVTMNGSNPRNATSQPLIAPTIPPITNATTNASSTDGPPNNPADTTAARPNADPTLMSMPPVSTTISSANTTTPMIDICNNKFVRFVPPQNTEPRVIVATNNNATKM
jgi:hypothetical protein